MRRRHRSALRFVRLVLIASACSAQLRPADPVHLATGAAGLSGLARGPDEALWAIPEERRELLRIDRDTGQVQAFQIRGMPDGLEAEALAFRLGPSGPEFVVGTETAGPGRPSDDLVVLAFDGRFAHVREMVRCPYGLWDMAATHNRGIEGLCSVGPDLVVAAELSQRRGERRFAPLGRRASDGRWAAHRLWLTSGSGKLAGLDCRALEDGVAEVFAIERHFGVLRLLRFELPPVPDPSLDPPEGGHLDVRPQIVLDLDRWVGTLDPPPNFEGIVIDGDQLILLNDNQYRGAEQGPSELWFVDLPDR